MFLRTLQLYFDHWFIVCFNISPYDFQVHPEGKFVVDVDKNIDINDVSILVFVNSNAIANQGA